MRISGCAREFRQFRPDDGTGRALAQVKAYNIRSTIISPGAVSTDLPKSITEADFAAGVQQFYDQTAISADSFARVAAFAISQPDDVDINEILFRPPRQVG